MNVNHLCRVGQMGFLVMVLFGLMAPVFSQDPCDWIEPQLELIPGSGPCCAKVILKKSRNAPSGPILVEDFVGLELELAEPGATGTFISYNTDPGWDIWLDELPRKIYFYQDEQVLIEIDERGVTYGSFCLTPNLQGGILVEYYVFDPVSNQRIKCSTMVDLKTFCFETIKDCCDNIKARINLKTLDPDTGEMTATVNIDMDEAPCDIRKVTIENSSGDHLGTWDVGGSNPSSWGITIDRGLFKRQFIFKFTDANGNVIYCIKTQDNWIEIPPTDSLEVKG